jgi:hypothetical protein
MYTANEQLSEQLFFSFPLTFYASSLAAYFMAAVAGSLKQS